MVGGECAVLFGEGEGCVDFAAVAGREADCFGRRGIVRAIGDFDGESGARHEGERGYLIVLHTCGIICRGRHLGRRRSNQQSNFWAR